MNVSTFFNNNAGLNDHDIEVVSILIATENGGSNITTTTAIADNNGYQVAALDTLNNGQNIREGFAYYRGQAINSWPVSDRRRVVIINASADSSSHQQWEILYNEEFPNYQNMIDTINAVKVAPADIDYLTWLTQHPIPNGQEGALADPDLDGIGNLHEFFAGTDPLNHASTPLAEIEIKNGEKTFRYRLANDRIGLSHTLQLGPLENMTNFTPDEQETTPLEGNLSEITVTLPAGRTAFIRQVIALQP